jgi:VCBS repeat-containing protein
MPSNGDTIRYSEGVIDSRILLNYKNPGPNQYWSFENLQVLQQGIHEYKSSSQTPYGLFVWNKIGKQAINNIDLAVVEFNDVYDFYKNSNSEFKTTHRGFSIDLIPLPIAQSYSDPDEIYQFPLNYGDRDSSNFRFKYASPLIPFSLENHGYRINAVDAWGTIKTPYGEFDCIRVKTTIVEFNVIGVLGINFNIPSVTREYKWISREEKIPILIISGPSIGSQFSPISLQFRDSIRITPSTTEPTALFSTPNRVNNIHESVKFNNQSLRLNNGNYEWSISPNDFQFTDSTNTFSENITVQFTDTGSYNVQLIINGNNGSDTLLKKRYIKVVEPNSISDFTSKQFFISPNPVSAGQELNIETGTNSQLTHLLIIDTKGSIIKSYKLKSNQSSVIIPDIQKGIYFLQIGTTKGKFSKKIIVI